jgi:hypothetical protein
MIIACSSGFQRAMSQIGAKFPKNRVAIRGAFFFSYPVAKRLFEKASSAHDEESPQRLVEEMIGSSYGDDALYTLGSIALERGDYDLARRRLEQISPTLRRVTLACSALSVVSCTSNTWMSS